jgi:hypothetical protein
MHEYLGDEFVRKFAEEWPFSAGYRQVQMLHESPSGSLKLGNRSVDFIKAPA